MEYGLENDKSCDRKERQVKSDLVKMSVCRVNELKAKRLNNEEKVSELVLSHAPLRASESFPASFVLEDGERLEFRIPKIGNLDALPVRGSQ